jgi:hydroxypyruvate isomerase
MRWSLNISISHRGLSLPERLAAAAGAGFEAVEMWWPFDRPDPASAEVAAVAEAIRAAGVRLALLNLDGGDLAAGERGILSHPAAADRFRGNLMAALRLAEQTGCRVLNGLYGNQLPGVASEVADDLAARHLALAARAAMDIGVDVVVESLNAADCPSYPLTAPEHVVALIDRVHEAYGVSLGYLCDVYHAARGGYDPAEVVLKYGRHIRHVQIADVPGRGAPGTGSIQFDTVYAALRTVDYRGYVGLECHGADKVRVGDLSG